MMARKLQKNLETGGAARLRVQELLFRVCIDSPLDNGCELKDLSREQLKELHRFISDTVYKKLTVSQVDAEYLRKQGLSAPPLKRGSIDLVHYGKDRTAFRIFGYYNADGYFSICRIDGSHKTNKQ